MLGKWLGLRCLVFLILVVPEFARAVPTWSNSFLPPSLSSCFRNFLDPVKQNYEWSLNEETCTAKFVSQELDNWAKSADEKEIANYLKLKLRVYDLRQGDLSWIDSELSSLENSWLAQDRFILLLNILWDQNIDETVYAILRDPKHSKRVQMLSLSDLGRFVRSKVTSVSPNQKDFFDKLLDRLEGQISFSSWSGGEDIRTRSFVENAFAIRKILKKSPSREAFRKAAISFPGTDDLFGPPPPQKSWSFLEHIYYVRALMRDVQSEKALIHIEALLPKIKKQFPDINASHKDFWTFLFLHTRILRILDRRESIESVLETYRAQFKIDSVIRDHKASLWLHDQFFSLCKLYWNQELLDDTAQALEKLKDSPYPVIQAKRLHTLARIQEQRTPAWSDTLQKAYDVALKNSALPQDLKMDLLWRRVFLLFDFEKQVDLLKALEELRPHVQKEASDRARFFFWMGEAFTLSKLPEQARQAYAWAYTEDPFSFYSVMSALKLMTQGEVVEGWIPKPHDSKILPYPVGENIQLDRARILTRLGQFSVAQSSLRQGEKQYWSYVFSTKNSLEEKRALFYSYGEAYQNAGEPQGTLRVAEAFRQAVGTQFSFQDFQRLYPQPFQDIIQKEASTHGVDPWLSTSLIRQESAFDPSAKSIANAIGLMQMIPPVAQTEARRLGIKDFDFKQLYEPATALKLGHFHLKGLLTGFEGCWICSIAAYNAGSPPVKRWLESSYRINPSPFIFIERISYLETRTYVRNILRNYINYQRAQKNGKIDLNKILLMPPGLPGGMTN